MYLTGSQAVGVESQDLHSAIVPLRVLTLKSSRVVTSRLDIKERGHTQRQVGSDTASRD